MLRWLQARRDRLAGSKPGPASEASGPASDAVAPLALYRSRAIERAAAAADALLAVDPASVEGLLVNALIALDAGRSAEASALLSRAVAAAPGDARLHVALGRIHAAAGRKPQAVASFEHALVLDPRSGEPRLELGLLALRGGGVDDAAAHFEAAVRADPALADAHFQLGNVARQRGDRASAEACYRRAIDVDPRHAHALGNLGAAVNDRGRRDEAEALFERALVARPAFPEVLFNLALLRIAERRWEDAAGLLRRSIACDPRAADAYYWLGNAAMGSGDDAGARAAYRAAIERDATLVPARWGLAMAQLPAIAASAEAQEAAPAAFARELARLKSWLRTRQPREAWRAVGAQQPFYLAYVPGDHRAALAEYGKLCASSMAVWAKRVAMSSPAPRTTGPLRVGIVSAHLHSHSVWHALVRGWVEHLVQPRFELHLFHVGEVRDVETAWAERRAALHFGIGSWEAWAKRIADSRLDALVYPEISMDSTTVRLAALRLARVQLAAWGHPITTGLPTIDGYVGAEAFDAADASSHYVEPLIRLPRLGCCYRPFGTKPSSPDLVAWGLPADQRFVLCAGTAFKYAPRHDSLLIELATRCAPCKLVFFMTQPDAIASLFEARLRRAFDAAAVSFDQHVSLIPWQSQACFFGVLDRADVYVDSVEFSGFNTTMQAVERGVPIVAWEGSAMRGRFASGILRAMGMDEWVAASAGEFVAKVVRLCEHAELRREVRHVIESRRAALYDDRATVDAFADRLEALASPPVTGAPR